LDARGSCALSWKPAEVQPIKPVILRWLRDELQPGDQAELDEWLAAAPGNRVLLEELEDAGKVGAAMSEIDRLDEQAAWAQVEDWLESRKKGKLPVSENDLAVELSRPAISRRRMMSWSAAAIVTALLGIGAWWVGMNKTRQTPGIVQKVTDVAAPQKSRATLTLASGQRISLDSAGVGSLAQQGGARVVKGVSGQINYIVAPATSGELLYNTLTNPRGSRPISLVLGDGTKVWLNAGSSIRYPVLFAEGERGVTLTGEGYFEVAKDAAKPFFVDIDGRERVQVLGTSFDIEAFADEGRIKTTLLEGKVGVTAEGSKKPATILRPGEQTVLPINGIAGGSGSGGITVMSGIDPAEVLAWKNGLLAFRDADLPAVMRQLGRWYDVDVTFEGEIPKKTFDGKLRSTLSLSQVLGILTDYQVHWRFEDAHHLVVRP
jgi:transmembrane sensor